MGASPRDRLWAAVAAGQAKMVKNLMRDTDIEQLSEFNEEGQTLLHAAITQGMIASLQVLTATDSPLDPNMTDAQGTPPLHLAIRLSRGELFYHLLTLPDIDPNAQDARGYTPLHVCVRAGQSAMLQMLLSLQTVDVNQKDHSGRTPLLLAAQYDMSDCLAALSADPRCDANAMDHQGRSALQVAVLQGHHLLMRLILNMRQLNINLVDGDGRSALFMACLRGDFSALAILLDANVWPGIDANRVDGYGQTALYAASCAGHTDCVRLLLERCAVDVNAQDSQGLTALYAAVCNGHSAIVRLLLQLDNAANDVSTAADPNIPTCDGHTAFYTAACQNNVDCIAALLESAVINVNVRSVLGHTALHAAADRHHTEIVKHLCADKRTVVDAEDIDGTTPLMLAAYKGHTEIASILLAAGASVRKCNKHGVDAFTVALQHSSGDMAKLFLGHSPPQTNNALLSVVGQATVSNQRVDLVQSLLSSSSVDVNARRKDDGFTALHIAISRQLLDIVSAMLDWRKCTTVDVNAVTDAGFPPLALALSVGALDVVRQLVFHPRINLNLLMPFCDKGFADYLSFHQEVGDAGSMSILHACCMRNSVGFLSELLSSSAPLDFNQVCCAPGKRRFHCLHLCVEYKATECLALLLEKGPARGLDANDKDGQRRTALHMACTMASPKIALPFVHMLLAHGSSLTDGDAAGEAAIHKLARRGNVPLLEAALSSNGVCASTVMQVPNHHGITPLDLILRHGKPDCLAVVLRHIRPSADRNRSSSKEREPLGLFLHSALKTYPCWSDYLSSLCRSYGTRSTLTPPNCRSQWPLLYRACAYGCLDFVRTALKSTSLIAVKERDLERACVVVRNAFTDTALHAAARNRHWDLLTFLLKQPETAFFRSADLIVRPDSNGDSLLHIALCKKCPLELLYILLDLVLPGKIADLVNKTGNTVLHEAVLAGATLDLVKTLLSCGCRPDARNSLSLTPAAYATSADVHALLKSMSVRFEQVVWPDGHCQQLMLRGTEVVASRDVVSQRPAIVGDVKIPMTPSSPEQPRSTDSSQTLTPHHIRMYSSGGAGGRGLQL